jgi:membrane peptidoglycan carboxypeptidase
MGYPKNDKTPLLNVEGVSPVFGGTIPAAIFHDFMTKALEGMPDRAFPEPQTTAGYTVGPQTPVPSPTPPPTKSPKPTRSPTPSPTKSPPPTGSPSPTDSPTPPGFRWRDVPMLS